MKNLGEACPDERCQQGPDGGEENGTRDGDKPLSTYDLPHKNRVNPIPD